MATANAILASLVEGTGEMKAQLRTRQLTAAASLNLSERRSQNARPKPRTTTSRSGPSYSPQEAFERFATLSDAPIEEAAPPRATGSLAATMPLEPRTGGHFRPPPRPPAPAGLASDTGPIDSLRREAKPPLPPAPSSLPEEIFKLASPLARNQMTKTLRKRKPIWFPLLQEDGERGHFIKAFARIYLISQQANAY